jgi:hypothetical protein
MSREPTRHRGDLAHGRAALARFHGPTGHSHVPIRDSYEDGNPGAGHRVGAHPGPRVRGYDAGRNALAGFVAAIVLALASASAGAQQLRTYTESETGPQFLTYGLPVPRPIDSLTPVDGFRSYAGVQARLQALALQSPDLSAHDVGRTMADRTVWAYVAGDEDAVDVEGRPEAAFFVNASTHAREWAAPEVATGILERLVAGAGDGGIVRYLLDNTRAVVIPVHNIDGVLQTQRYPTDVLVGQDPDFPAEWPRDGRMRRKNMRGVDEVLATTADHLLGVDLNRNHPPFWATSPDSSSNNPNSLVFYGSGPHSEPENQALLAAARLAPESRLRLGIDVHTFSKVFYSSNTARTRLNTIQRTLIARLINHHEAVAGARYVDVPDPPNRGIGAAAEYFSYQWLVPGWTLELEPTLDAAEYGGTTVTHGGFILPASQARRVREGWAETHLIAFYQMSGPPHLVRVRYVDVQSGAIALQTRWRYDASSGRRERATEVPGTLAPGRRYRVELAFSKPMRWRDPQGNVASIPGMQLAPAAVNATLLHGTVRTALDTSGGVWLTDPARVLRYRDDSFAFEFTAPDTLGEIGLEVATADFTNANLDADPSTPADWAQGAWSEYENAQGTDGDLGGADRSSAFTVAPAAVAQVTPATSEVLVGEGDRAVVRVLRAAGSGRLELRRTDVVPPAVVATWEAGASGERSFAVELADDVEVDGERLVALPLQESIDGVPGAAFAATLRVLDNDAAARAVWRVHDEVSWMQGWNALAAHGGAGELVVDRGDYRLAYPGGNNRAGGLAAVRGRLVLRGNGATVMAEPAGANGALFAVAPSGTLELDALRVELHETPVEPLLDNAGSARIARSTLIADAAMPVPLLRTRGQLDLVESGLHAALAGETSGLVEVVGGNARIAASSLGIEVAGHPQPGAALAAGGGDVVVERSSLQAYPLIRRGAGATVTVRGSLLDETFGSAAPAPPAFHRPACTQPMFSAGGGNLVTAHYPGGTAADLASSGCLALTGEDVFDASVALERLDSFDAVFALRPRDGSAEIGLGECAGKDQRGAPRPQHAAAGVSPPHCDAGAYEGGLDPFRGIWGFSQPGQGIDLQTLGNRLFLAWYTHDTAGEPTAYQATAVFTGPHWEATLQQSSRDVATGQVSVADVGHLVLEFTDDTHARIDWTIGTRSGSDLVEASEFASGTPAVEATGLWYPPSDSGHGATIARRGDVTAIGVYYYDAQGRVRWALGTGSGADAQDYSMTWSSTSGETRAAGRVRAHFHTPREAQVELQLTYPGAAGGTWQRAATRFVPLNDAVDNLDTLRP